MTQNPTVFADAFTAQLESHEMPFMKTRRDKHEDTAFTLPVLGDYLPCLRYVFIEDEGDTRFFILLLRNLDNAKRAGMLQTLSDLNNKYKLIGLNMDEDGDISIKYDFQLYGDPETAAEQALKILLRLDCITDEVVPVIMKEAFSDPSCWIEDMGTA